MSPADQTPSLRQALALGLLQGPSELLPVSSSAHTTLLPWLAGSSYPQLPGGARKSLEVALHTGAGLALAATAPWSRATTRGKAGVRPGVVLAAVAVPAAAGIALGGRIERRAGTPRSICLGLLGGSLAMALADRRPVTHPDETAAGLREGLALGAAQALALVPGVSRNGATLAAGRAMGFDRAAAQRLSWAAGLPVLLGVSLRELVRLTPRETRPATDARSPAPGTLTLLAGAAAAFVSTALSARIAGRLLRAPALAPFALYRSLLAIAVLVRSRRSK
jgi:undecaprenyl-diphosphatase